VLVWSKIWRAEGEKGKPNYCFHRTPERARVPAAQAIHGSIALVNLSQRDRKTLDYLQTVSCGAVRSSLAPLNAPPSVKQVEGQDHQRDQPAEHV
jgi:hypothetical protein